MEQRIRIYTDLAHGEVSSLGAVEEWDGGFLVDKVFDHRTIAKGMTMPSKNHGEQCFLHRATYHLADLRATAQISVPMSSRPR